MVWGLLIILIGFLLLLLFFCLFAVSNSVHGQKLNLSISEIITILTDQGETENVYLEMLACV